MKIALVSPYDFAYPGGVANHITNLDQNLRRMGHDVRIIAPASRVISAFGDRFIPIGKPHSIPTSGSICRITLSLRLSATIKAVLSREKFDIVHLHEPFMPMLCSAVLRFSDTVNVGTFHACDGSPGYNLGWPVSLILARHRARKLDGRIAVSKPAMEFAGKYIPGAYEIIPNGVDLGHFSPEVAPIEEFRDGKQNIVFLGRLERRKGLIYLLRAFKQVKETVPNSRLVVVGPGTALRRIYERWIKINKLEDIVFVGHVPYDQVPRYYQTADIFCAPAISRESFGIVLIEAMAIGKPIIASNIKGYASVLTHGQEGWLVPPKNSQELARALLSLLGDPARRQQMGAKGILNAREYSWEKVAGRVVAYYTRVINSSPKKDNL